MTSIHDLNRGWQFRQLGGASPAWSEVDLPHSSFVADLDGREHWFGECEYRRTVEPPSAPEGTRYVVKVGAAMHTARVFIDDREVAGHVGGYLPFEIDLTDVIRARGSCVLMLRLDNRDHPDVPPGKPYDDLDFCWYSGLYREVQLLLRPAAHITDAVAAGEVAGGGVFLRTLEASDERAIVGIKTHIRNCGAAATSLQIHVSFRIHGIEVGVSTSEATSIAGNASQHLEQHLTLRKPELWSPDCPHLHEVVVTALGADGRAIDSRTERFGVRRITFSRSGGFTVNDHRLRLRGTNRHQEFPRVGYAAPRAAQFRDAVRIKEAGFDYVRLSHYPQSPDFLNACDELGIVVMNCIPGWQFIGGKRFRECCQEAARHMIRRDRNHACVVLWELSLNETAMDDAFMSGLHAIGHEEYPGDQMFTCGWIDRYDVFSHSRQHGQMHRWHNGDKALVIAEYGDWEFFARNEGFDQKSGAGIFDAWSTARQFRSDGERGLRQQVSNHIIALNDTLSSPAVFDGQWAMFDYARGYDSKRAAVGVMDIFRLPKFSYYFYRSQRELSERGAGWTSGPMVFIASHWTAASDLRITVFSNCEEVELRLNGTTVAREHTAETSFTQHLPHPPFYFDLPRFTPGKLEAIGYVGGKAQSSHVVATPDALAALSVQIDDLNITAAPEECDVLFAHARLCDSADVLCVDNTAEVSFAVSGGAAIIGPSVVAAEAGIASIVIRVPAGVTQFKLLARTSAEKREISAAQVWRGTRNNGAVVAGLAEIPATR